MSTRFNAGRANRSKLRAVWAALAGVLALTLACSLPSVNLPGVEIPFLATRTATAAATALPAQPPPTAGSKTLPTAPATANPPGQPPVLLEAQPPSGSDLPAASSLTFYFSTEMDAESVQRSMQIQPQVEGKVEWLDSQTMRFTPQSALPPESDLQIVFNNNVRSKAGKFLVEPVEVRYQIPGPPVVVERLPLPDSNESDPSAAIVTTFNRAVVPLLAGSSNLPPAFTLEPQASGRGEWLNPSTYLFYPNPPLAGGQTYTAQFNSQLGLDSEQSWRFTTAAPGIVKIEPSNRTALALDAALTVQFNQSMDRSAVENSFSFVDEDGASVPGKFTWDEEGREVRFQPGSLFSRGIEYRLSISTQARSQAGTPLPAEASVIFETVGRFSVAGTRPAGGQPLQVFNSTYGTLSLVFNAPLSQQDFDSRVVFSPLVQGFAATIDEDPSTLNISGYFQPATAYRLTLTPELEDAWGQPLELPYTLEFRTAPALESLQIPALQFGGTALFLTTREQFIPAVSTNITRVEFVSGNISVTDYFRFMGGGLEGFSPQQKSTWQETIELQANQNQAVNLPLTSTGSSLTPGIYYYAITSPQISPEGNTPAPFLAVVSDIHLVLKRSAGELFVWADHLENRAPVTRAEVSIYDSQGMVVVSGVTDDQGIARMALPAQMDRYAPLVAVMGKPGEAGFSLASTAWNQMVAGWNFGLPLSLAGNEPVAYVYTDRPIYRPGQTVNFRAVVRQEANTRYTLPELANVRVKISGVSESGEPPLLFDQQLDLSAYGTVHGSLSLPAEAVPGYYTIQIEEIPAASLSFQVAAYRKPEFEVQVNPLRNEILPGQGISALVKASYYFGAPVGQLPLRWSVRAEPVTFHLPEGFVAGKSTDTWLRDAAAQESRLVAEGQAQTNAEGTLALEIPPGELQGKLDEETTYRLVVEVTAQEESQQPVSARGEMTLHPASVYVGVRPDAGFVPAGTEIGFDVQVVNWQREPSGGHAFRAEFRKVTWKRVDQMNPSRGIPEIQVSYSPAGSVDFGVDELGRARVAFTPTEPGVYQLDIRGGEAVTGVLVWVGGEGSAAWPELPNQQIELEADAEAYRPGETARVLIPNPFPQGARALVTVERGQVMRWQLIDIQAASQVIELPLSEEDAPNIYISVLLLARQEDGRVDFRQGYTELKVSPAAQIMKVRVDTQPAQAGPGEPVTVTLQAQDTTGRPVKGEFSLALVDQAVLALADPNTMEIGAAFYGEKPLGVINSLSLAAHSQRVPLIIPGRGGGAGGDDMDAAVRQAFADTAFWNAAVETGEDGLAQVQINLPDNLTTWVVDARGVTAATLAGSAQAEIVATKELLIRPVVPRFLVVGDHVELAAVVHNNSSQSLPVEISLDATGMLLDRPDQRVQTYELARGERRRITWWATAQPVNQVDLLFAVRSGGLQDSARPEQGSLPVLRYVAPETFATSGVLTGASERQEWIGLPRSFEGQAGEFTLELSPSLLSTLVSGLRALETFPRDLPEAIASRLLPNLETYQALQRLGVDAGSLQVDLNNLVRQGVGDLARLQNADGSWGWNPGSEGDARISAQILFSLARARLAGVDVPPNIIERAAGFLAANTRAPADDLEPAQYDGMLFQTFVLNQAGGAVDPAPWLSHVERLSPASQAMLALILHSQGAPGEVLQPILSGLEQSALRSASGARWESADDRQGPASTTFTTAAVLYALAILDPASPLVVDGSRYLVSTRQTTGGWYSSLDTAWALIALVQALQGTGDLGANYAYSASLNGTVVAQGQVTGSGSLMPVGVEVPLAGLNSQGLNQLQIQRGEGVGRLYYRGFLRLDRPVETALPLEKGLSIQRKIMLAGQDCRDNRCPAISEVSLGSFAPVLQVQLTLTVPADLAHVVVEDSIPAGTEIWNPQLKTSQQMMPDVIHPQRYDPRDPFQDGWGAWRFSSPQIGDQRIRWYAGQLPAGTYQLTYRLVALQAGEYRIIPARAFAYYFPEIQGSSAGAVLSIQP